jgi:hypothetical protein
MRRYKTCRGLCLINANEITGEVEIPVILRDIYHKLRDRPASSPRNASLGGRDQRTSQERHLDNPNACRSRTAPSISACAGFSSAIRGRVVAALDLPSSSNYYR